MDGFRSRSVLGLRAPMDYNRRSCVVGRVKGEGLDEGYRVKGEG
jgi:hypothetical protein